MVSIELLLLPLSVRIAKFLKKKDRMDAYDTQTNFNPLNFDLDYKQEENKFYSNN